MRAQVLGMKMVYLQCELSSTEYDEIMAGTPAARINMAKIGCRQELTTPGHLELRMVVVIEQGKENF